MLLTGVALRVAGFLIAGLAVNVEMMFVGVILIGFAAALFSPAVEATLAREGVTLEKAGVVTRSRIFALDNSWSQLGALTGPVLGALLIPVGFAAVCITGAVIFAGIFVLHLIVLRDLEATRAVGPGERRPSMLSAWGRVLRNRTFVVFALLYSTYLAAYNQQYLALPVELRRATGSDELLGWFFAIVGVFVVALQGPVNRVASTWRTSTALVSGFLVMAASFLVVAAAAPFEVAGPAALAPALTFVLVLQLGMMIAVPISRDLVGTIAGDEDLGSYYGFLNSFGGLAVLIASTALGALLDAAETPGPAASVPWLVMAVVLVASAAGLGAQARRYADPRTSRTSRKTP